jgi:hypothetical protein
LYNTASVNDIEAFVETQSSYILSQATELELTRKFNTSGVTYKVLLVATNLVNWHNNIVYWGIAIGPVSSPYSDIY